MKEEETFPVLFSSLNPWVLSRVIQNYCNWTNGGTKQLSVRLANSSLSRVAFRDTLAFSEEEEP